MDRSGTPSRPPTFTMTTPAEGLSTPRHGKRKVRIVRKKTGTRAALASLIVASLAAAALFGVWSFVDGPEPERPYVRDFTEVQYTWSCSDGHRFRALGQVEPRLCPHCGKEAFVVDTYVCEKHGAIEVFVRFHPGCTSTNNAYDLKLPNRRWTPAQEGISCPKCTRKLSKARKDPLGRVILP